MNKIICYNGGGEGIMSLKSRLSGNWLKIENNFNYDKNIFQNSVLNEENILKYHFHYVYFLMLDKIGLNLIFFVTNLFIFLIN